VDIALLALSDAQIEQLIDNKALTEVTDDD
jgi:hypothetical protein